MTATSDRDSVAPTVPTSAVDCLLGAVSYALKAMDVDDDNRNRMLRDSLVRIIASIRRGELDDIKLPAAALLLRDFVDEPVLVAS